jgi:hypothetical protein
VIHIGIDSGLSGAATILASRKIEIYDCPKVEKSGRWNRHDSAKMYGILRPYRGKATAVLEHVRFDSRDDKKKGSIEVLIRSHEAWRSILEILEIPVLDLEVPIWRKAAGCSGLTDAAEIVRYALTLYPEMRSVLKVRSPRAKAGYKYEHNRAEALLMAHASKLIAERTNAA